MKLKDTMFNLIDSVKDTIFQIKLSREKDISYKVVGKILYNNGRQETVKGLVSPDKSFCFFPDAERIHFYPKIYYEKGKQFVYLSHASHSSENEDNIINISNQIKTSALIEYKTPRKWIKLNVKDATSTINFNLFDNEFSPQFAKHSFLVVQTKILHFLKEQTNIKLLLMMLSGFLFGVLIGFLGSMFVYLIILMFNN